MKQELIQRLNQELEENNKKIIRDKITQSLFGADNSGFAKGKTNEEIIKGIDEMVDSLNDALVKGGISCLESAIKELEI